mgnify:CR=1 FL=1
MSTLSLSQQALEATKKNQERTNPHPSPFGNIYLGPGVKRLTSLISKPAKP